MPAKSVAQRRFFAIAEHEPDKLQGKMPNMSKAKMHDFAAVKEKGLPAKLGKLAAKRKKGKGAK